MFMYTQIYGIRRNVSADVPVKGVWRERGKKKEKKENEKIGARTMSVHDISGFIEQVDDTENE